MTRFAVGFLMLAGWAGAQRSHPHVVDAKREYAAIFSHPDTPCTGAQMTTLGYEECMGKELAFLQPHVEAFLSAVHDMEADRSKAAAGTNPSSVEIFEKTDGSWKVYRDNLWHLAFNEFQGGTGAAPAEQHCIYEQDRAYVKTIANWTELKILAD